jgi:hypothetical protein
MQYVLYISSPLLKTGSTLFSAIARESINCTTALFRRLFDDPQEMRKNAARMKSLFIGIFMINLGSKNAKT